MPVVTPTLVLCDSLVSSLNTAWGPTGSDGVERAYFKDVGDADAGSLKLEGRRVVVYPTGYDNSPYTRGEDGYEHSVSVQVFERYADAAGDPPRAWVDERVDFVFEKVVQGFDFGREPPSWNRFLRTLSAEVVVLDVARLLGNGRLFVSQVDLIFEELRSA